MRPLASEMGSLAYWKGGLFVMVDDESFCSLLCLYRTSWPTIFDPINEEHPHTPMWLFRDPCSFYIPVKCNRGCCSFDGNLSILWYQWTGKQVTLTGNHKGAIIFYPEGGPSVCDCRSPIFSGPPLCLRRKILVPPFDLVKKFWSPQGERTFPSHKQIRRQWSD